MPKYNVGLIYKLGLGGVREMTSWMRRFLWKRRQGDEIIYFEAQFPGIRNFVEFRNKFVELGLNSSSVHLSRYDREKEGRAVVDIEVSRSDLIRFKKALNLKLREWRNCITSKI